MMQRTTAEPEHELTRVAIAVTLGMLVLHLLVASQLELMFDEAYYRLWAQHLAWGYHDHPPLTALWIRVSTLLFGTSEFGVRALGVVATAAGSVAIWAMARDLFQSESKAALAVLIWNACPLIGVGAILVTPDTPLLFGWTTAVWALCRIYRSGNWYWWLLVGFAAGLALEAKYTALFLGPGIMLAMLIVPELRRWWLKPAPYAGGAIALAMFAPNIVWNAQHGWETFAKQFGRVADAEWTLRFVFEFFGSQIGLLNPLTFVLVVAGLLISTRRVGDGCDGGRRLLAALCWPLLVYFAFHSLHDRVQGNWLAPLYPVFALIAADAAMTRTPEPVAPWVERPLAFARRWTVALGLGLTGLIYAQAFFAPFPVSPRADPTTLLQGWRQLAGDLATVASREKAGYVLTQGYALTALLKTYGSAGLPVFQFSERYRWAYGIDAGAPDATLPGVYIVEEKRAGGDEMRGRFAEVREIAKLERRGHGAVLDAYLVYLVAQPTAAILDPIDVPRRR